MSSSAGEFATKFGDSEFVIEFTDLESFFILEYINQHIHCNDIPSYGSIHRYSVFLDTRIDVLPC